MEITLDFELLPWQKKVWNDPNRFQVIAAGRRTGKTRLAAYRLAFSALKYADSEVAYITTTQGQARRVMWRLLIKTLGDAVKSSNINNLEIYLVNGTTIYLLGADRPDPIRGIALRDCVLDEYADMKEEVYEEVIRPCLSDFAAPAMFIGTPKGRNHFYKLFVNCEVGEKPDYKAWHFTTYDNPFIPKKEIDTAKKELSSFAFRQEYEASFEARGSEYFKEEWIQYGSEPKDGHFFIAGDLAGFNPKAKYKDDSALAVVKADGPHWWVAEIMAGQWGVEETARRIFRLLQKYEPVKFGLEKGIAQQAVEPYLRQEMEKRHRYFKVHHLTHGGQNKTTRILYSLEGKFEDGLITINKGDWNIKFLDQLFQFPDPLTHDDMIDALAYVDQIADYHVPVIEDYEYEPMDNLSGY